MGARFAKWRAVIRITDKLPSVACVSANAHALARYAALCQEQHVVPRRARGVDERRAYDRALRGGHRCGAPRVSCALRAGVSLGRCCSSPAWSSRAKTGLGKLRCRRSRRRRSAACADTCPQPCPASCSCQGGQKDRLATAHLNAMNRLPGPKPWTLSFSYGRGLQDAALEGWHGRDENLKAGQHAFYHRARCNGAATRGEYSDQMEAG